MCVVCGEGIPYSILVLGMKPETLLLAFFDFLINGTCSKYRSIFVYVFIYQDMGYVFFFYMLVIYIYFYGIVLIMDAKVEFYLAHELMLIEEKNEYL